MQISMTRRHFCGASAAAGAALAASPGVGFAASPADPAGSLKMRAARAGIAFGTQALYSELTADPAYAALVERQCAVLTPGIEAKWAESEPDDGAFDFSRLDWMVRFAERNGMAVRGHNLVWSVYNPLWVKIALLLGRGPEILRRHITTEVGRYKGRVAFWDVVNEPTDPKYHPLEDGLVDSMWRRSLGPSVMDDSFRWAAEADPSAMLFVNDDTLEYDEPDREEKRNTYLRLIERWLARGVPIKGFGLESHLRPPRRIAAKPYRRFLHELGAMGLTLHITELDVVDRDLPADPALRDRIAADYCKQLLDIALDEPAVKAVVTWGLSDRYTYMNADGEFRRPDGLAARCLPYDAALNPKPMWHAIADALDHAPSR